MSRRSREIGWSQEAILLYEISRQLDAIIQLRCSCTTTTTTTSATGFIMTEGGDFILDENGNPIILE